MDCAYCVHFMFRRNSAAACWRGRAQPPWQGFFGVFSAGEMEMLTIQALEKSGYTARKLRPKHWSEFTRPDAPVFDFVFTLSSTRSRDKFPDWPGQPAFSHWHYPDPIKIVGQPLERRREFAPTLSAIERQMRVFMQRPLASVDAIALQTGLAEIGREHGTGAAEASGTA
jgi:arsenate reductase